MLICCQASSILPVDVSECQASKIIPQRKLTTSKRSRPPPLSSNHLPKLIKKPEPIPVTLNQFQAV